MPSKKLTVKILEAYTMFQAVAATEKANASMPFKLAWEIADVKASLLKTAQRYEEERLNVIKSMGEESTTNVGNFEIKAEDTQKLNESIKELNETEVEIEFTPISLSRIQAFDEMKFAAGAFEVMRKDIIEFPAAKEDKKKEKKEDLELVETD